VRVRGRVALERELVIRTLMFLIVLYLVLVHGYVHLSFEHAELLRQIYGFRLSH
jgi:hypothetical protein